MADSFTSIENDFENVTGADEDLLAPASTATSQPFDFEGVEEFKPNVEVAATNAQLDQLIDFGEPGKAADTPNPSDVDVATAQSPSSDTCQSCCSWIENVDSRLLDVLYWRDIKKTGALFASSLSLLLSLAWFSIVSVLAYMALIVLTITVSFRLYKTAMGAVQRSGNEHPFKAYLETDITLPADKVYHYADAIVKVTTGWLNQLRHFILTGDWNASLKFGLVLWVMTCIGAWFNGMTLVILADVGLFTLPKVYDTYRAQINENLYVVIGKLQDVKKLVQEKVPFLGKPKEA